MLKKYNSRVNQKKNNNNKQLRNKSVVSKMYTKNYVEKKFANKVKIENLSVLKF